MAETIRIGMIGLDTSHCGAFAGMFNDPDAPEEVRGFRVVAAYPSFSPDVASSAGRIEEYKQQLIDKHAVKMADSVEALVEQVDVVLLTSVDGRRHLAELRPVAKAGKPCYIDKPFAASLADAKEMVKLIKEHRLPCFSASSLRFDSAYVPFQATRIPPPATAPAEGQTEAPVILGCDAYAPASLEPTNPGFFWYGIHGVEILYTIMGVGCRRVQCTSTPDGDLAVGVWADGRLGTMRGIRKGPHHYGANVMGAKGLECRPATGDFYKGLCRAIAGFFRTGQSPVPIDETLELCAFIDAAWRSSRQGGDDLTLDL